MTKKHYEAIAASIKIEYADAIYYTEDFHELAIIESIAHNLADYFATDNANFDRDRFLQACGIERHCLTCSGTGMISSTEHCQNCSRGNIDNTEKCERCGERIEAGATCHHCGY